MIIKLKKYYPFLCSTFGLLIIIPLLYPDIFAFENLTYSARGWGEYYLVLNHIVIGLGIAFVYIILGKYREKTVFWIGIGCVLLLNMELLNHNDSFLQFLIVINIIELLFFHIIFSKLKEILNKNVIGTVILIIQLVWWYFVKYRI